MAQSHDDASHLGKEEAFKNLLAKRAEKMAKSGESRIAGGETPEEQSDPFYRSSSGFGVKELPSDPQQILRVSVGGGKHLPVSLNYLSFRGDVVQCAEILEEAALALREYIKNGGKQ